jgi:hypothetical protein
MRGETLQSQPFDQAGLVLCDVTERQAAVENARGPDPAVGLGISANKPVFDLP